VAVLGGVMAGVEQDVAERVADLARRAETTGVIALEDPAAAA
jgi:hypothetical protein